MMTSPEGDHQANGLGVREIKAQTGILRSQLEQRLDSRIGERSVDVVDTTSCSELCVQIQNHGRWSERLISVDVERFGKRPVVEFGELVHFRPVG